MALLKTGYKNGAGVSSEYWRIIDYRINQQMKYADISFGGWVNEACRASNMEQSDTPRKVRCMKDKFDGYFGIEVINGSDINMLSQMYKFAKENDDFFLSATDLLDTIVEGDKPVAEKATSELLQDNINALQEQLKDTTDKLVQTEEAINFILMNY